MTEPLNVQLTSNANIPSPREVELGMSGANGTRTRNPLLAKQVRYQLRHSPEPTAVTGTCFPDYSTGSETSYQTARS